MCVSALLDCSFDPRAFRWAQTMRLAVEEINQSTELLPNYTLGHKIFDSCAYPLTGQRAALALLNGLSEDDAPMCSGASPLLAVIGESSSALSIVLSRILQPFRIPMVLMTLFLCNPPKNINLLLSNLFFVTLCIHYLQPKKQRSKIKNYIYNHTHLPRNKLNLNK